MFTGFLNSLTSVRTLASKFSARLSPGSLTSCGVWGRSGTCKCAHTAAALEQIQLQVLRGGRGGNIAGHFSEPPVRKRHLE